MTAKEYTDWWGEAGVVSLNRTQYMGIVADLAAAEEREEWWKNVAATADKHRMEMMDEWDAADVCRDRLGEQLRLATVSEANAEAEANDLRGELAEANRQIDALAAEKRELQGKLEVAEHEWKAYREKWELDANVIASISLANAQLREALDKERKWFETEDKELSKCAKEFDDDGNYASRDRCLYNAIVTRGRAAEIRAALALPTDGLAQEEASHE